MKIRISVLATLMVGSCLCSNAFAGGGPIDKYQNVSCAMTVNKVIWKDSSHRRYVTGAELARSQNNWKLYVRPGESFIVNFRLDDPQNQLAKVPLDFRVNVDSALGVLRRERQSNIWTATTEGPIYLLATIFSTDRNVEFRRTNEETVIVSKNPAPAFRIELSYLPHADGAPGGMMITRIYSNVPLTSGQIACYQYAGTLNISIISDQGSAWQSLTIPITNATFDYDPGTTSLYQWWTNPSGTLGSSTTRLADGIMKDYITLPALSATKDGAGTEVLFAGKFGKG